MVLAACAALVGDPDQRRDAHPRVHDHQGVDVADGEQRVLGVDDHEVEPGIADDLRDLDRGDLDEGADDGPVGGSEQLTEHGHGAGSPSMCAPATVRFPNNLFAMQTDTRRFGDARESPDSAARIDSEPMRVPLCATGR